MNLQPCGSTRYSGYLSLRDRFVRFRFVQNCLISYRKLFVLISMSSLSIVSPERRIELNPFDVDAWNLLLRESQARPIDQVRSFYEKLVTQFPNAGRYWKAYIDHERAVVLALLLHVNRHGNSVKLRTRSV
ncbi:unnamed protein product [Litomosoides sigmodontis]|uniref:Suppressor of forked domain-containing protein n=1 Tax=Litomosoides sigmodontis TaxID=42156 RepID=A0A3P6SC42_LITSI|nr:unnamed protein product [Litomosoides sigmodontis]